MREVVQWSIQILVAPSMVIASPPLFEFEEIIGEDKMSLNIDQFSQDNMAVPRKD